MSGIGRKAMEAFSGGMGRDMWVSGEMGNSMGKGQLLIRMGW